MTALSGCAVLPGDSPAPVSGSGKNPPPDGLDTGLVTTVTDGDSIDVDIGGANIAVRLTGINAPEINECYGDEALNHLIEEIAEEIVAIDRQGTDQFGRALADVWFGDRLINLELVELGLATATTPDLQSTHGAALLAAESAAFEARIGMWGTEVCNSAGPVTEIEFDLDASEINPPGPDDDVLDDEYITIVNSGGTIVDLSGWTLRDESSRNRLIFPAGSSLRPGGELAISSGCSTTPAWCGSTSIWNNDGDLALLLDENGRVIARARY